MDLVSQKYWDASYNEFGYHIANDEVTAWINRFDKYLLKDTGSVFELGCFPGRYLSHLGQKGWTVNGMDLTPRIEEEGFRNWLTAANIKTGLLAKGDVLAYAKTTPDRYEMVCSFGFIEHFENFQEIISLHDNIVQPGGLLMITTPNFRGTLQKILHTTLDKENLSRHYLPSMKPLLWKKQLEDAGYNILFAGYFGNYDFWCDDTQRNVLQRMGVKAARKIKPFMKQLPDNALYSPYCGIMAQKKGTV